MSRRIGKQTVRLENRPRIISTASVVGPKEAQGPLKEYFDIILEDDLNGKETFEKAESSLIIASITKCISKANLKIDDIDYLFAGDLLNQLTSSNFAARDLGIPYYGLYGACSTMTESLSIASVFIDGGYADYAVAATSSHFSSAERQFRYPLEFGSQRGPTAQWTVTGSGAMLLGKDGNYPYISYITTGKVKDFGVCDANNMGEAMAPAAVDTIYQHFVDTGRNPDYYDLIATGDLGRYGKAITEKLLLELGYDIRKNYIDCGDEIFDHEKQGTKAGGSGCGCSAVVDCSYVYKNILKGKFKKVLIVSTGALLSSTSCFQGESIPGIAHGVTIEV